MRRGFTLLEILVTIALMALLATVLITGAGRMLSDQPETPEEILGKAVEDARQMAVTKDVEVRLSFDAKEKAFKLNTEQGEESLPVAGSADLTIEFLSTEKTGPVVIIGGEVMETTTAPYVRFFPDGTSSPFRVQIRLNGQSSRIEFDPWTCAPILEGKKQ